jgi:hypothetical protein
MKTLKSYVKFITEASIEPQKPLAEVWQQIYKELSPKAHKKSNMMLNWGENAKQGGKPGQLGFTLSSEANRITIWCDRKQITDIEKKVSEDFGNLTRAKSDGSTYIIYEYGKNDAATPVMFANYIIDELKPVNPNEKTEEEPVVMNRPDIPMKVLDKPTPDMWAEMSKSLKTIGTPKIKVGPMLAWGEHKNQNKDTNKFGISISSQSNIITINCNNQEYTKVKNIIDLINQESDGLLKIQKDEKPTTGMYSGGGTIVLQYPVTDTIPPIQLLTKLKEENLIN